MPGKIVESNANIVNESKAEWHMTGNKKGKIKIYAKSNITATLEISSNPSGAKVYINGTYKGKTPITLKLMSLLCRITRST